eukprot:GSA120T00013740001.1
MEEEFRKHGQRPILIGRLWKQEFWVGRQTHRQVLGRSVMYEAFGTHEDNPRLFFPGESAPISLQDLIREELYEAQHGMLARAVRPFQEVVRLLDLDWAKQVRYLEGQAVLEVFKNMPGGGRVEEDAEEINKAAGEVNEEDDDEEGGRLFEEEKGRKEDVDEHQARRGGGRGPPKLDDRSFTKRYLYDQHQDYKYWHTIPEHEENLLGQQLGLTDDAIRDEFRREAALVDLYLDLRKENQNKKGGDSSTATSALQEKKARVDRKITQAALALLFVRGMRIHF